jgi:predicted metal-dependent peptidase
VNQEARTILTRARISMVIRQPFFGTLALRLKLIEDATLNPPTAAVDGRNLYYHPDWVLNNAQDVVESMVAHEVGHCVFDHISRRNGRDPWRWNQAGDFVINAVLKDAGFTVPDTWLYSQTFAGLSTDEVYQALPPASPGKGGGGAGSPFDTVIEGNSGNQQEVSDDWQIAAVQAAAAAQAAGKLPGSLKRFIDEITTTKADWRAVLWRFVTEIAREDYSYARVNRKFASLGIFLPGLYSQSMGLFVDAIDTSGSITNEILKKFGSEISAIKDAVRPERIVNIYCDAAVNHVDEFEQNDELTFAPHGGGGTDFRPPFAYIEEHALEPKCMVYLTDGYGPFPDAPPRYPVLWLMTTDVQPPWGEVVRIEE